jgi:hypothetical protein
MQRKPALAVAAAVTIVCGGGLVAAAATTGMPVLGFAEHHIVAPAPAAVAPVATRARVVKRTKVVYDNIVVPTTAAYAPPTNAVSVGTYVQQPSPIGAQPDRSASEPVGTPAPGSEPPDEPIATPTTTVPIAAPTTTVPHHHHESDDDGTDDDGGTDD